MNMEQKIYNEERRKELRREATWIARTINEKVRPFCAGLNLDASQDEMLEYVKTEGAILSDYMSKAREACGSEIVWEGIEASCREKYNSIAKQYPINYDFIGGLTEGCDFVKFVDGVAFVDESKILEASEICLTEYDREMRIKCEALCEQLNKFFGGKGHSFFTFIALSNGRFAPSSLREYNFLKE